MPNGNGNGERFKLVAVTRTNLTQVHSDEVRLNNGEFLNAAKRFDGREEAKSVIAELLGVEEDKIKEQKVEDDGMVTFVGVVSDLKSDPNTGNSLITTRTVTIVTERDDDQAN